MNLKFRREASCESNVANAIGFLEESYFTKTVERHKLELELETGGGGNYKLHRAACNFFTTPGKFHKLSRVE